jgi:hypothetical protein
MEPRHPATTSGPGHGPRYVLPAGGNDLLLECWVCSGANSAPKYTYRTIVRHFVCSGGSCR